MPNWTNKDKRISFLSVFSTLMGIQGANDAAVEPKAYAIVDRLFVKYPADEVTTEAGGAMIAAEDLSDDPFDAPETLSYQHEPAKWQPDPTQRKPFVGSDNKTMYPTTCGKCNMPTYSPTEGQKTKACKACRT